MYDADEFLTDILKNKRTLEQNRAALAKVLSKPCAEIINKLNFQTLLQDLTDGISEHLQISTPSDNVRGIHFGLRENVDGCSLYIAGTHLKEIPEFRDTEVWDWTGCHHGNLRLATLPLFWNSVSTTNEEEWEVTLSVATILLKAYLDQNFADFTGMLGIKDIYVTVGFDDGDIYRLV